MIRTKDLVEYVEGDITNCDLHQEYIKEIVARLKEHSKMRVIITNPHLTGDHTMRDLLKLVKSGVNNGHK